jgi:hypothetical protein
MKEENKKSHALGVRLDNKQYEHLLDLAQEFHLKKSQVLKKAFDEWIMLKENVLDENIILISRTLFREILAIISDDELTRIGQIIAKNFINKLHFKFLNKEGDIEPNAFLERALISLGPVGHSWFDDISYKILDNRELVVFGSHSINEKFSKYVKAVLRSLMKEIFDYEMVEQETHVSNNTIELKFLPYKD